MGARSTAPFREGGAARRMVGRRAAQGGWKNSAAGGVLRVTWAVGPGWRKTECGDREELHGVWRKLLCRQPAVLPPSPVHSFPVYLPWTYLSAAPPPSRREERASHNPITTDRLPFPPPARPFRILLRVCPVFAFHPPPCLLLTAHPRRANPMLLNHGSKTIDEKPKLMPLARALDFGIGARKPCMP